MTIRLATQSVGDALVASLRERILSEDIRPGRPVTEASVAGEYEVSRQTAKAAIERLVSEGLLERAAHRSARVPVLDESQVRDLYFARGVIESRAYELLAAERHLSSQALAAHRGFRDSARSAHVSVIVQADVEFHRALVDSLGSERLTRAHQLIINEMCLCLAQVQNAQLLDAKEIADEHEGIVQAIQAGDVRQAGGLGLEHLKRAELELLAHMRG